MNSTGMVIVISGPSGSGKSTICDRILAEGKERFGLVTSHTSRKIRSTETHGEDYWFVTKEEFQTNMEQDKYLEWAEVHGNYYGTPRDQVDQFLKEGKDVVLEIDVQGGLQIKEKYPESLLIFVSPPTFNELERRLTGRGTDSDEIIARRVKNAVWELEQIPKYDYLIFNDKLDKAVEEVQQVISVEKKRVSRLNMQNVFGIIRQPDL
jgi:guanylate kinase